MAGFKAIAEALRTLAHEGSLPAQSTVTEAPTFTNL
jgi:hypothetical protein